MASRALGVNSVSTAPLVQQRRTTSPQPPTTQKVVSHHLPRPGGGDESDAEDKGNRGAGDDQAFGTNASRAGCKNEEARAVIDAVKKVVEHLNMSSNSKACWVLCELGGKPFNPVPVCHMSGKLRHKMLQRLRSREKRVHGSGLPAVDEALLEYIINQVWRGRCPATDKRMLTSNCLELCRWDRSPEGPGCVPNNLVLLDSHVANTFDTVGRQCLSKEVITEIERTLAAQRADW